MPKYLFLDDIRNPSDAFAHTAQSIFLSEDWQIVRSFEEFVHWIKTNGLPEYISFDHDLGDVYGADKEKTGYDCAIWLVDYCLDAKLKCPAFYCHSMNPVGREKIVGLLEQFSND